MPELPEVETIAANLRQGRGETPSLVGLTITGGRLLWERSLAIPTPEQFWQRITGQSVQQILRRGKFLVFDLTTDTLLIHLRMSGDVLVQPATNPLGPHLRLVLSLGNQWCLAFNDARKFGRTWLLRDPEEVLGALGPEPLADAFTAKRLHALLQKRHRQLKPLLLDQRFLAGMGNIYADESLHLAGLHPLTLADEVQPDQVERLWKSIRQTLQAGIDRNGASIDWVYRGGDFQNYFRVYQRSDKPCSECGTTIQRITVGQRGTYFCPSCQPLQQTYL